ncbi:hypothetical protein ABH920_000757 [Catenulispora sp. EB89]|uniref:hypothetical protein n=1 Tax=Catenulispora sp. EB89 TaxID=3156257 RepID=UPI0035178EAE
MIILTPRELVLSGWSGQCREEALRLRREDIVSVDARYTELYGRFVGGILNAGKPLILSTRTEGVIYLLIDWKEFTETTRDRQWAADIKAWLASDPLDTAAKGTADGD